MYLEPKINCCGNDSNVNGASDTELNSIIDPGRFHECLRIRNFTNITEVERYYGENVKVLKDQFGILLFLYTVISTKVSPYYIEYFNTNLFNLTIIIRILVRWNEVYFKFQGLEQVKLESDTTEPLIDETYGYGSQSLINLMITGKAVTYVWDYEQDVGGLSILPINFSLTSVLQFLFFLTELKGLDKQSQIGFITSMEHLRYLTVGSFYKNPVHPIWVLGSETHLTGSSRIDSLVSFNITLYFSAFQRREEISQSGDEERTS